MCGRFDFHGDAADLVDLFAVLRVARPAGAVVTGRYNVCPTSLAWTVRDAADGREALPMRFGMARRAGGLILNARGETAASLPTFRGALAARRCLVPVHGFYEWARGERPRQPSYFAPAQGGVVALAALYFPAAPAASTGPDVQPAAVIVTGAADATVAPVHPRMPLVLPADAAAQWLASPAGAAALIAAPPAAGLVARRVSTRVNGSQHDDAGLIAAVAS